jgi:hypothetical protein
VNIVILFTAVAVGAMTLTHSSGHQSDKEAAQTGVSKNAGPRWSKVSETPYDAYMEGVHETLSRLQNRKPGIQEITKWMEIGYRFRYQSGNLYSPKLPARTESSRSGDCKDKALWLAEKLNDRSIRYVIGRLHRETEENHAWLEWQGADGRWILDCTKSAVPFLVADGKSRQFVPLFSYTADGTYANAAASIECTKLTRIAVRQNKGGSRRFRENPVASKR